jgi:hypothetical protein
MPTVSHAHTDMDDLLRRLMVVGFVALILWSLAGTVGLLSGFATVAPEPTLRFLLAILIVTFARRTYWELREWRWRRVDPDDRFGFTSPIHEAPRVSWEHLDEPDTGSQQPEG